MSVTKWCSSLYFTLKTTLFFYWIPFHYITFELNSLLLSSYPKQIRKKRFVSWGLELKSQTWKLDEVHKIHDVQGVPFLVKSFTGFFFLVLDEERCNMSWGQGKTLSERVERKWGREEAILIALITSLFFLSTRNYLAWERDGKEGSSVTETRENLRKRKRWRNLEFKPSVELSVSSGNMFKISNCYNLGPETG